MRNIFLLKNYREAFGNKYNAKPHHSGFDKNLTENYFKKNGYNPIFISPAEINFRNRDFKNELFLYTSTEDTGLLYKSYIEDIVLALSLAGAIVIPSYQFLHAHHNKVMMEFLRDQSKCDDIKNIVSKAFGTFEEFEKYNSFEENQWVIKKSHGASSLGVYLSRNNNELPKIIKKISYTGTMKELLIEKYRTKKYNEYRPVSLNRQKFIVQNFITGLQNDFKMLVFGHRYYVLERPTRKNDFRASGSGKAKYKWSIDANYPDEIFPFAKKVFDSFNVPMISLDIAFKDKKLYLLEFQFVGFGNSGQSKANEYFVMDNNNWIIKKDKLELEQVYVESIVNYINTNNL
ncbi:MAG: hypothetical protein A2X08_06040 [Bacteroidetes bacterium GWA2_32_17]|nr:MAG: hypothetical protein A2X08_06040 [Bacteroidetes bacterium GWA2_32_17]